MAVPGAVPSGRRSELRQPVPAAHEALILFGSVAGAFLARCGGAAASFAYGLLLASVLRPSAMGEFAIAVSVALIAATVAKCGLDMLVLRDVAERPQSARRVASHGLAVAGLVGALLWVVCVAVGLNVRPDGILAFGVFQLAIPFLAMSFVLAGLFKARNLPAAAIFLETGGWQMAMCVCAVLMHFAGSDSLLVVAIGFAAGSALAFAAFLAAAGSLAFDSEPSPRGPAAPARGGWFRRAAPLAGVSVCHVLIRWSDTLWLAWWFDAQTVAVYVVCTRLAGGISFAGHAISAVAAPRFARHHGRGETVVLRGEFRRACAMSGAFGMLGAAAIAVLGSLVLGRLGPPYADAVGILQVAAVLMAAQVTLAPVGHLATMSGRAVDHLWATGAMLALQQVAYVLLTPRFGMAGALFGFALPQAFASLLTLAMLRRRREFGWLAR